MKALGWYPIERAKWCRKEKYMKKESNGVKSNNLFLLFCDHNAIMNLGSDHQWQLNFLNKMLVKNCYGWIKLTTPEPSDFS